jgi:hypothetical protein
MPAQSNRVYPQIIIRDSFSLDRRAGLSADSLITGMLQLRATRPKLQVFSCTLQRKVPGRTYPGTLACVVLSAESGHDIT